MRKKTLDEVLFDIEARRKYLINYNTWYYGHKFNFEYEIQRDKLIEKMYKRFEVELAYDKRRAGIPRWYQSSAPCRMVDKKTIDKTIIL